MYVANKSDRNIAAFLYRIRVRQKSSMDVYSRHNSFIYLHASYDQITDIYYRYSKFIDVIMQIILYEKKLGG